MASAKRVSVPPIAPNGPNLYAYVHNAPLTQYDPYGLFLDTMSDEDFGYTLRTHANMGAGAAQASLDYTWNLGTHCYSYGETCWQNPGHFSDQNGLLGLFGHNTTRKYSVSAPCPDLPGYGVGYGAVSFAAKSCLFVGGLNLLSKGAKTASVVGRGFTPFTDTTKSSNITSYPSFTREMSLFLT